jgi:hypothetical protein
MAATGVAAECVRVLNSRDGTWRPSVHPDTAHGGCAAVAADWIRQVHRGPRSYTAWGP